MYFMAKSESVPWASAGKKPIPLDFVDRNGPRGYRSCIERFLLDCQLNITTVAANTIVGADMARFCKKLLVRDSAGPRIYFQGDELRVLMHAENLDATFVDPTTHGASATQTDEYILYVNLSQERGMRRPYDFAVPVDDLVLGGAVELEMPANSDLFQTGAGATINAGATSFYVLYVLYREEQSVEFHARDQREEIIATTATSYLIPGNGRLLRCLYGYVSAQGGGASFAALTDFTIEMFRHIGIPNNIAKQMYLSRAPVLQTQDPFFNGKAFPYVIPRLDGKIKDFPNIPGNFYIRANSTIANVQLLVHWVTAKDEAMAKRTVDARAVRGGVTVKTADSQTGGVQNDIRNWTNLAPYMPLEAASG